MKLVILQIKDIETCDYAFRNYDADKFKLEDYEVVFCRPDMKNPTESDIDYLDRLFEVFNWSEEYPQDFTGHSLSVSDLVSFDDRLYYCDSFGWERIK